MAAYCGTCLYASNACAQSLPVSGGIAPETGFHSVIERPDSVSRVIPPTMTISQTSPATVNSHVESLCRVAARETGRVGAIVAIAAT